MKLNKLSPQLCGFLQALGIVIYVLFVGLVISQLESFNFEPPHPLGITMVLTLLVFSAAVSGTLVFGYPAYLLVNKETKRALMILGFTFLFLISFLILVFVVGSMISA